MPSKEVDMKQKTDKPFPEEGKFPSGDDFCAYVARSIEELGITAYLVSTRIPGNTNNNIVREIERGVKTNPTARTMKQVFDAIEEIRLEQAAIEAAKSAAE